MDALELKSSEGFFVGDITYAISDELLDFWETVTDSAEGILEAPGGHCFGIGFTTVEDSTCTDAFGNEYHLEGCFGVIPLELMDHNPECFRGTVFSGPGMARFEYGGDEFTVELPNGRIVHIDLMEE